jgi:hypothetical protein
MSIIQGNVLGGVEGAYQIERSLRFNSADSAYLNRTPGSAGNRDTWTYSAWIKRSVLSTNQTFFSARSDGSNYDYCSFNTSDQFSWAIVSGGSTVGRLITTQVFRDVSSWYHFLITYDSGNATGGNRMRFYVNGTEVIAFGTDTNPSQNQDGNINNTIAHNIGRFGDGTEYCNYYQTETYFIDGSALDPTSFGEFNSDTGVWQPKAYTGSYGAQGWFLNFSDNASTTTLGDDLSGNGNDWSTSGFSVTAGAGNDSLVDTPTPYGTDTGVGGQVRGNYATLNPLSKSTSSGTTPTNGNLDIAATATACDYMTTMFVSSGKWYFEVLVNQEDTSTPSGNPTIGIYGQGFPASGPQVAVDASGALTVDGSVTGSGFFTYTTGNLIGVAFDMDAKKAWFSEDGVYYNSGDPAAGTNATGTWSAAGEVAAYIRTRGNASASFNAGQRPFAHAAPSGFKALCTQNLPEPTIVDGGEYFNTVLYTGTGSTRTVTGVGFQPDWVWVKDRTNANSPQLADVVRGFASDKGLQTTNTLAEGVNSALYGYISGVSSDGFSVAAGTDPTNGSAAVNASGDAYVAWNWKANGSGVSNTDGTITSTVSANTDSGFSIVTYTGTGSNATVGHGLGAVPRMIIVKNRDQADAWQVYHAANTANPETDYLVLNTTAATADAADRWNDTLPTSTVFSIGNGVEVNTNTEDYVAYVFAAIPGYSAMGSFVGNGSTDGSFVYLGFRPRFIMFKCSTAAGTPWVIVDTSRNPYNPASLKLAANNAEVENGSQVGNTTENLPDINANGFKMRSVNTSTNGSGETIIYMAFAENPFKYSLAR